MSPASKLVTAAPKKAKAAAKKVGKTPAPRPAQEASAKKKARKVPAPVVEEAAEVEEAPKDEDIAEVDAASATTPAGGVIALNCSRRRTPLSDNMYEARPGCVE
jgi:hypothetical protein